MALPLWRTDLRPLFMHDPFSHAGVYDGLPFVLGENREAERSPEDLGGRGCVLKIFREEVEIQKGIVTLLLAAAGPLPAAPVDAASILRRLRLSKRLVLSEETLGDYFETPLNSFQAKHWPFLRRLPPPLLTRTRILENREIFLHSSVPAGIMLDVQADPAVTGVLNAPDYFPYPVGLGVRPKAVRAVHRLEPWREPVKPDLRPEGC